MKMSVVGREAGAPSRWNQNGAPGFCLDAFSSREPVSTSLENALAPHPVLAPVALPAGEAALAELQEEAVMVRQ
ncbi:hypothetical protein CWS35_05120 [Bradyrhizobium sp. SK17]|nr:hypothetical protein CWS35_05120 [Bradyrhizobium sp. SK17]